MKLMLTKRTIWANYVVFKSRGVVGRILPRNSNASARPKQEAQSSLDTIIFINLQKIRKQLFWPNCLEIR